MFKRDHHNRIQTLLSALNTDFLKQNGCYFGGGTAIVLALDEYRESVDIDFLCASQDGYRELRNTIDNGSLGAIFARPVELARDVRADRYGIPHVPARRRRAGQVRDRQRRANPDRRRGRPGHRRAHAGAGRHVRREAACERRPVPRQGRGQPRHHRPGHDGRALGPGSGDGVGRRCARLMEPRPSAPTRVPSKWSAIGRT